MTLLIYLIAIIGELAMLFLIVSPLDLFVWRYIAGFVVAFAATFLYLAIIFDEIKSDLLK